MGYYTYFRLRVCDLDGRLVAGHDLLRQWIDTLDVSDSFDDDGYAQEMLKGYHIVDDTEKFSLLHPEYLFVIRGEGEDTRDIWATFVVNGKSYYEMATIVDPQWDHKKWEAEGRAHI